MTYRRCHKTLSIDCTN